MSGTKMTGSGDPITKSELKYRRLFEAAQDGILLLGYPEGRVEDANPFILNLIGYSLEDLLGKRLWELGFIEDKSVAEEAFRDLITNNYVRYENIDLKAKDGRKLSVEFVSNVYAANGDVVIQCNIRDISDRVKAEKTAADLAKLRVEDLYGSVTALSNSIEARDPYTAGHQFRVSIIAENIAQELDLDQEIIAGLVVAARLHDIGKFGIPMEILGKPGNLNDAEFQLIRGHPSAGYEILKSINFPWDVARFVLEHHERIDGSGYPRGLTGKYISFEAKILGVADTVEAMSSHRPYRAALGVEAALEELTLGKGMRYDEKVVNATIRLFQNKSFNIPPPIQSVF